MVVCGTVMVQLGPVGEVVLLHDTTTNGIAHTISQRFIELIIGSD
jgi:hypothetical protein